jgi:hypothetical protein
VGACDVANHGVWVMNWLGFLYCIAMDYENRRESICSFNDCTESCISAIGKALGVNAR